MLVKTFCVPVEHQKIIKLINYKSVDTGAKDEVHQHLKCFQASYALIGMKKWTAAHTLCGRRAFH